MLLRDLLDQDRERISAALRIVQALPRPSIFFDEHAHSGEVDLWQKVNLSTVDSFVQTVCPSGFVALSNESLAYYLPLLLGIIPLDASGWYGDRLFEHLSDRESLIHLLSPEAVLACIAILDRVVELSESINREEVGLYTGVSIFGEVSDNISSGANQLRNSLGSYYAKDTL